MKAQRVFIILQSSVSFLFSAIFVASSIYQVTVAGLSPLQLVLVGTTLEVSVFLFEVPTGVIADVYSRRLSIIIGYVLTGCGFLLEGSIPRFGAIVLAQVLWGIGYTFTSGATQAWISDEVGEEAANQLFLRTAKYENSAGLAGIAAGTLLGLAAVNLPILLGGLFLLGLAIFLALAMPETGFTPTPRGERSSWQHLFDTFLQGVRIVQSRPLLINILVIGFIYGLYSEGFDRLWTKHLIDNFTLPTLGIGMTAITWSGFIRIGSTLLSIAVLEWLNRRLDTGRVAHLTGAMLASTLVVIAALLVFAWSGDSIWLVVLALWAINIARQVIGPLYTAWVNQKLDSQVRATIISMSSQVDAVGQIGGGPVVGWIGSAISVRAALTVSSVLLTPAAALLNKARKE